MGNYQRVHPAVDIIVLNQVQINLIREIIHQAESLFNYKNYQIAMQTGKWNYLNELFR